MSNPHSLLKSKSRPKSTVEPDAPVPEKFDEPEGTATVARVAQPEPALTFGFAAWSRAQIREGLSKFAAALNSKLN